VITLSFRPSEGAPEWSEDCGELAEHRRPDPLYHYFWGQLTVDVDGRILQGGTTAVLLVASLPIAVRRAALFGFGSFGMEVTGSGILEMTRVTSDTLLLSRTDDKFSATVSVDELRDSVDALEANIRRQLLEVCPGLLNLDEWGWWFREEPDPRFPDGLGPE
jgi:hypothetical protein